MVSAGGRQIGVCADASVPADTVRHLLIDQVLPLAISHLGHLVLHAGAVALQTAGQGVAFIGPAGAGKSTLTASLTDAGCRLLADDALVVSLGPPLLARPAYPGVRLWPEVALPVYGSERDVDALPRVASYTAKRRVRGNGSWQLADQPVPLERVHLLAEREDDQVVIERLRPRDALVALLSHTYVLDVSDRDRLQAQFVSVSRALAAFDVRRLGYPRTLDRLGAVRAAIIEDLRRS